MPWPMIASRSSSSTSSESNWSAISAARSARKVGVATFEGRVWRAQAGLGLAQLDKRLEGGFVEGVALEQSDHARVRGSVCGGALAGSHLDVSHGRGSLGERYPRPPLRPGEADSMPKTVILGAART